MPRCPPRAHLPGGRYQCRRNLCPRFTPRIEKQQSVYFGPFLLSSSCSASNTYISFMIKLALTFRRAQLDLQLASRFIRGMFKQREALYTFSEEGPFDWRPRPGPLADGWKAISVMYFKKWKDEIAASHVSSLSGNLARTTPRQDLSVAFSHFHLNSILMELFLRQIASVSNASKDVLDRT
jgi:hypothetical protein